jgi:hypothetical protein
MTVLASDDFTGAGTASINARTLNNALGGTGTRAWGSIASTNFLGDGAGAVSRAGSSTANNHTSVAGSQKVRVKFDPAGSTAAAYISLRRADLTNGNGPAVSLFLTTSQTSLQIREYNGTSFTTRQTTTVTAPGAVIYLELEVVPESNQVIGRVLNSDTSVRNTASWTYSSLPSGDFCGFGFGNAGADGSFDDFTVEDAAAADTTAPTLTGSITEVTKTENSISIAWPAGADNVAVTSYEVSSNAGSTYTDVGNVLAYTITGLTANTAYALRVRAKDAAGNVSTPALELSVTTPAPDTVDPVLTGSITASSITSGTFSTTCPAATDNVAVAAYDVSEDGGSTWIDNGLSRTYSHTGKTAETTYQIRWRARDGSTNTSAVLSLAVTTFAPGATGQYILDNTGPTGENQAGVLYNDVEVGDEDKWFSFVITTPPASGTLDIAPDGTFTFTGAASTTFYYQLYVDGVAIGTPVLVTVYDDALVQFYRPTGDVSAPGWLSTAGTLAGAINETTPSDASYITSPDVGSAAPYRSTIASMAAGTYTMRLRARRTASVGEVRVVMLSAANAPVGTSAWQALSTGFAAYSLPVTTTGTATQFDLEVRA